jgi:hypothetical protein
VGYENQIHVFSSDMMHSEVAEATQSAELKKASGRMLFQWSR